MTPYEEAIGLISKYEFVDDCQECGGGFKAKQCAIICVNEILKECHAKYEDYYEQVKIEIEKL